LKPMIDAFDTTARLASDSVIPPTPRWTNDRRTSLVLLGRACATHR